MLDKHVGDALLKLDLSPQTDPPFNQIERIIDTDQRRVKRWMRIAIALWILAALGALLIFIMGAVTFPAIAKMNMQENKAASTAGDVAAGAANRGKDGKPPRGSLDEPGTSFQLLAKLTAMVMVFGTASFMLLVFAGIATVLLLLRSRTATFRQINANLLQISEQLKRVPPASTGTAGT